MHKLVHLFEADNCMAFISLPSAVQTIVVNVLTILDDAYGTNRDLKKDLGGYVVLLESPNDIESLKDTVNVNLEAAIFEYIDAVSGYLGCLLLLSSDYHLYFVMPYSIAPPHVLSQITP
nr:hypothetical protein [uncultured Acetobacterium sp.]